MAEREAIATRGLPQRDKRPDGWKDLDKSMMKRLLIN